MTEKRYGMSNESGAFIDKKFNKEYTDDEIIDLLNELSEENEQLKQLLDEAEDIIMCQCTPHYQRQWENIKKNLKGDVE